jgi:thioredoxin
MITRELRPHVVLLGVLFLLLVMACTCGRAATPVAPSGGSADASTGPYDSKADPTADIAAALQTASADNKYVLLDFGANWCPDCIVLDQLYKDPKVEPYLNEHFVVVRIDVGYWDHNLDISKKYGNPIDNGIPAVVILDTAGDTVATTGDGSLANARTATPDQILTLLQGWASLGQ